MLRRILLAVLLALLSLPALAADVLVVVDISDQKMRVAVDGVPTYRFDVSTGRKGYATPTGRFGVIRMYRKYASIKYDNAPMPYAIFFYRGYAIHGTTEIRRLGQPASHGCIRLHPDNARLLFNLVKANGMANTTIRVQR